MSGSGTQVSPFDGLRILVVEDAMVLALSLEDLLEHFGARPLKAASVESALAVIGREPLDGALLDINLGDEEVYPVAEELAHGGIPFVFMTGYDASIVAPAWRDRPLLTKPFDDVQLERAAAVFKR